MNAILRSFLLAIAGAALDWLVALDESDVVINWLHNRLDAFIDDTENMNDADTTG